MVNAAPFTLPEDGAEAFWNSRPRKNFTFDLAQIAVGFRDDRWPARCLLTLADIAARPRNVRFTPKSGHAERVRHARGPPVIVSPQSARRGLRELRLAHQAYCRQRRRPQGARCTTHTYQGWSGSS